MDREEARQYAKEYRRMGFARYVDRAYYLKHCEDIKRKQREKYRKTRKKKK